MVYVEHSTSTYSNLRRLVNTPLTSLGSRRSRVVWPGRVNFNLVVGESGVKLGGVFGVRVDNSLSGDPIRVPGHNV